MDQPDPIPAADAYDLLMGLSQLTGSPMVADIARVVGDLNPPGFTNALNTKQLASKRWLLDAAHQHLGGALDGVVIVGGWHGVLSSLLLNDRRFVIGHIASIDLDPSCAPVAGLLNRRFAREGRFEALTDDMFALDYTRLAGGPRSVVINTSCEHIADLRAWLALLPRGQRVILQSNDYRVIPEHVACVGSAAEFAQFAGLSEVSFQGALPTRNYTRFMLIGQV